MPRCVLIVGPRDQALGEALSQAFQQHAPSLSTELTDLAAEQLDRLGESGYDAVVCWAERSDELDLVVRLRKSSPNLPIMLVSSETNARFRDEALEKGATTVLPDARSLPTLVDLIEQAVELRVAARETRSMAAEGRALTRDIRELTRQTNALTQETRRRLERSLRPAPLPLLVSNDAEQAFLTIKAFEKAEVFAPLPILRSPEEAMAYLSGRTPFEDRARFPMPSLILLDIHGSRVPGMELLGWIRQNDRLKHLPVIVLSSAINAADLKGAYGLQANSYLIKPGNFEELVEMVKAINLYWSSLNINPDQ